MFPPSRIGSGVDAFFAITLVTVFLMNVASSIFQSSTFGFAGVLPSKYTAVVMSGQVRGVVMSWGGVARTGHVIVHGLAYNDSCKGKWRRVLGP